MALSGNQLTHAGGLGGHLAYPAFIAKAEVQVIIAEGLEIRMKANRLHYRLIANKLGYRLPESQIDYRLKNED